LTYAAANRNDGTYPHQGGSENLSTQLTGIIAGFPSEMAFIKTANQSTDQYTNY